MPEGPSILHLKSQLTSFIGNKVTKAGGYGPMEAGGVAVNKDFSMIFILSNR